MNVTDVDQRLQLVHFPSEIVDVIRALALCREQLIHGVGVARKVGIRHREIHLRREVVRAVVPEAERGLELLDRHELGLP